ncbi:MAG TPA: MerR family transcriptional regulator [Acidobacteriota bacterium]|nr:MerR family transcriptional regulator [Acidobacteriota bacterium]
MRLLRIGELAQRTAVTVRTLHYYDEIGLLAASYRSEGGHRLYGKDDLARLYRIRSLQQLGMSLEEIRQCLDQSDYSPLRVLEMHIERVRRQVERQQLLLQRLSAMADLLRTNQDVSVDQFLDTMEVMSMIENYYTPEQLQRLKKRGQAIGQERIEEVQREWVELFQKFEEARSQGVAPESDELSQAVSKYQALIAEFTGGQADIEQSLANMYQAEGGPRLLQKHDMPVDEALWEYIGRALKAHSSSQ